MPDYYGILELDKNAKPDDIRAAYRKLAKEYHPDAEQAKLDPNSASKFQKIQEAYDVLIDPEKRREYDRKTSAPTNARTAIVATGKGAANLANQFLHNPTLASHVGQMTKNMSLDTDALGRQLGNVINASGTKKTLYGEDQTPKPKKNKALEALKLRYAKGKITEKQFERMKEDLDDE